MFTKKEKNFLLQENKRMNTKNIWAILIAMLIVAAFMPGALAEKNEEQNNQFDIAGKLAINNQLISTYKSSATQAETTNSYPIVIKFKRIGIIRNNISEYSTEIKVGYGKYDKITLVSFAKEKSPYHITATKTMDMLLGQGLTQILYREQAIETAKNCGCAVYIISRREDNIKLNSGLNDSQINAIMKKWSNDKHLSDIYYGVIVSKFQTAFLAGKNPDSIKVTAWGHSLGAKNWDDYDKMDYDKKPFGSIIHNIQVDMIINYDNVYKNLIATQKARFNEIKQDMNNGTFYSVEGAGMISVTAKAANPQTANNKSILPGLENYTNIQVFRLMNFATWQFEGPFTPNFHYLDGDLKKLYDVNESEMMEKILNGGVVPHTPLFEDLIVAGQLGEVPAFQTNASKVDADVTSISFRGGLDYFTEYSPRQTGNENSLMVTTIWYNVGGHASLLFAKNPKVDKFWKDQARIVREI